LYYYRSGNDIWGWVDPTDNKEYAIMGTTAGTTFVDVTDPQNPVAKCYMDTAYVNSPIQFISKYIKSFIYIYIVWSDVSSVLQT
jgi:hypothetical protein